MALPVGLFGALLFAFEVAAVQLAPGIFGHTAPLTEPGYIAVAALKSNDDMKAYIHRVCESEARYVRDAAELNGFVPFYSGEKAVQSFEGLRNELRRAVWVANGEGRTAALNENGYQQVAKRNSTSHMTAFARRVLDNFDVHVTDEGAFKGLLMHHSGKVAVQSYAKLKQDLFDPAFGKFLKFPDTGPKVSIDEPIASSATGAADSAGVSDASAPLAEGNAAAPTATDEFQGEDLMAAFRAFDLDGSSRLSTAELKQAVKSLEPGFSVDDVDEMLIDMDKDGNGEIDAEELKAKMKE